MTPRLKRILVASIAVKIVLFVLFLALNPRAFNWPDTSMYTTAAQGLLATGSFQRDGRPEIFRVPGYPLMLAPIVAICGPACVWLAVPAQIGLGIICGLLARRISRAAGHSDRAAALAWIVVALDPAFWLAEFSVLSEVLFATLLVGAVWMLASAFSDAISRRRIVAGFALLTMATFVRPIALYLPYIAAAVLVAGARMQRKTAAQAVAAGLLVHVAATGAWQLRAAHYYGRPVFSTVGSAIAYEYFGAAVLARTEGGTYAEWQHRMEREGPSDNPAEQAHYKLQHAIPILLGHPVVSAVIAAEGIATTLVDPGTYALANMLDLRRSGSGIIYVYNELGPVRFVGYLVRHEMAFLLTTAVGALWMVAFWLAFARGMIVNRGIGRFDVLVLVVIGYLLLASAGPAANARFRVPVIPLLAVYVGVGADLRRRAAGARLSPA